jgi:hypothetical protein
MNVFLRGGADATQIALGDGVDNLNGINTHCGLLFRRLRLLKIESL